MFPAEFFVPSTLNTDIGFRNRVKGMFLSLVHFLSIKITFTPLSSKASVEMKGFFPFGDMSIFKTISLLLLILLVLLVSSGISSSIFLQVWKEESSTGLKPRPYSRQAEDASWHGENVIILSLTSLVLSTVNILYLLLPANQMHCSFSLLLLFPFLLKLSYHRSMLL